jgi:hypothetical protein
MDLLLKLEKEAADWTISKLLINGAFQCFVLEDEARTVKVRGETRIPAGRYRILLRKEGGFHERYSKRFGTMHVGMLWLQDVPGFQFILIHLGNTDEDTDGCLLLGQQMNAAGSVTGSERAYRSAYPKIAAAIQRGEEVWITVQR